MQKINIVLVFVILLFCTYTDVKERIIYTIPLLGVGCEIIIANVCRIIWNNYSFNIFESYVNDLWVWVFGPVLLFGFVAVISVVTKESVGMGDAYILGTMTLSVGIISGLKMLFLAIVSSGIYSTIRLAFTGSKKDDSFPFAPFVLGGFIGYYCIDKL